MENLLVEISQHLTAWLAGVLAVLASLFVWVGLSSPHEPAAVINSRGKRRNGKKKNYTNCHKFNVGCDQLKIESFHPFSIVCPALRGAEPLPADLGGRWDYAPDMLTVYHRATKRQTNNCTRTHTSRQFKVANFSKLLVLGWNQIQHLPVFRTQCWSFNSTIILLQKNKG